MGNDFGIGSTRESSPNPTANILPKTIYPSHQPDGQCQPTACQKGRRRCRFTSPYMAPSITKYASVILGTMICGPGVLLNSVADVPEDCDSCKASMKNMALKKKSAASSTSPMITRSNPLQGGFSASGFIETRGSGTSGSVGGSSCISGRG